MAQENMRQDVNGSTDKPYPQERNFVIDAGATQPTGMGTFVPQTDHENVANRFGQVKYAVREGAKSIYKDETRYTRNDRAASDKAEGSTYAQVDREEQSRD